MILILRGPHLQWCIRVKYEYIYKKEKRIRKRKEKQVKICYVGLRLTPHGERPPEGGPCYFGAPLIGGVT